MRKHKGNHNVLCRDLLFSVCLFVIFVFLLFFSSWVIHDFVIFVQIGFFSVFWYPAFLSIGAFSCFVNSQLFASKFRFLTKLSSLFHYFIINMENLQLPTAGFHSNHSILPSEAQKKKSESEKFYLIIISQRSHNGRGNSCHGFVQLKKYSVSLVGWFHSTVFSKQKFSWKICPINLERSLVNKTTLKAVLSGYWAF